MYQWMSQHCQEYGFIVRYPKDKEDVTGALAAGAVAVSYTSRSVWFL